MFFCGLRISLKSPPNPEQSSRAFRRNPATFSSEAILPISIRFSRRSKYSPLGQDLALLSEGTQVKSNCQPQAFVVGIFLLLRGLQLYQYQQEGFVRQIPLGGPLCALSFVEIL